MDKAPDAFRTISEVADLLETPAHVLRFWETRFPQVKPVKGAGGRRYYRPADVALLAGIRQLLHNDGMTIRGVQKILRDQGVHHVAELGGAEPAAPEALADLLPPARPEAEVVALRPSSPPAREAAPPALEKSAAEPPRPAAPRWSSAPLGDTPPAPWSPPEPAPLPALLAEGLTPPTEEVKEPVAFAPPMGSIGGFGLDLDAPREGSGGFIAFTDAREPAPPSKPEGLVHPDARPKAPKGEAPPRQPSLFDFSPEDGLTEEEADEAPFIHIAEEPAPLSDITPFAPESDRESDPEVAIAALMAEEAPEPEAPAAEEGLRADDLGAESWATEEEAGPEDARFEDATSEDATSEDTGFEGASFEGLGREDFPGPAPGAADDASDDLQADDWSISPPDSPPDAESTAPLVPQLAGLAPRLRRLGPLSPEALLPLADLQARLGLLHAQMVEAQGRSRRTPGA